MLSTLWKWVWLDTKNIFNSSKFCLQICQLWTPVSTPLCRSCSTLGYTAALGVVSVLSVISLVGNVAYTVLVVCVLIWECWKETTSTQKSKHNHWLSHNYSNFFISEKVSFSSWGLWPAYYAKVRNAYLYKHVYTNNVLISSTSYDKRNWNEENRVYSNICWWGSSLCSSSKHEPSGPLLEVASQYEMSINYEVWDNLSVF